MSFPLSARSVPNRFDPPGLDPMDVAEDVLEEIGWVFTRKDNGPITLGVEGRACTYRITLTWDEDVCAFCLSCRYENLRISQNTLTRAHAALTDMNMRLPLGHFRLEDRGTIPAFAHSCLMSGLSPTTGREHIRLLLSMTLARCEEAYLAFALLARSGRPPTGKAVALALMATAGRA